MLTPNLPDPVQFPPHLLQAQDIGSLMHRAGFAMITLDTDEVVVGYPHVFALLADLQGMAESNANRRREPGLRREVLLAADAIYRVCEGSASNERD